MVKFSKISEATIIKVIVEEFRNLLLDYSRTEVLIIGAGPAGLMAGKEVGRIGS